MRLNRPLLASVKGASRAAGAVVFALLSILTSPLGSRPCGALLTQGFGKTPWRVPFCTSSANFGKLSKIRICKRKLGKQSITRLGANSSCVSASLVRVDANGLFASSFRVGQDMLPTQPDFRGVSQPDFRDAVCLLCSTILLSVFYPKVSHLRFSPSVFNPITTPPNKFQVPTSPLPAHLVSLAPSLQYPGHLD